MWQIEGGQGLGRCGVREGDLGHWDEEPWLAGCGWSWRTGLSAGNLPSYCLVNKLLPCHPLSPPLPPLYQARWPRPPS